MYIKTKYKVMIVVGIIVLIATIAGIFAYIERERLFSSIGSSNAEFVDSSYEGVVEYSADVDFMFVINKEHKVSNLIFLEQKSLNALKDKNIEGSNIETAVYEAIRILNEEKLFTQNIILTSYQSNNCLSLVEAQVNKNLIVFGSNVKVSNQTLKLSERLSELGLESKGTDVENVKMLYDQSKNKLLESAMNNQSESNSVSYIAEAQDIYRQLDSYAKGQMEGYKVVVENQQRNDPNGLLLENVKSKNGLTPTDKSWYQIVSKVVYASIVLNDTHEYCFNGSADNYTEGACK